MHDIENRMKSMAQRVLFLSFCCSSLLLLPTMATPAHELQDQDETKVYIVYLGSGVQAQPLLISVLGSEEAAKSSLLYTYSAVTNGFSAKLTASQAATLAEKPGVLRVSPSQTLHLHGRT